MAYGALVIKDVLQHVGLLKNQILVFVILGCIILLFFGSQYFPAGAWERTACFLFVILIFAGTTAFYLWAAVRLPGSAQEMMFERNAARAIEGSRTTPACVRPVAGGT